MHAAGWSDLQRGAPTAAPQIGDNVTHAPSRRPPPPLSLLASGTLVADARVAYTSSDWAAAWRDATDALVAALPPATLARVAAACVAGTSASVLLVDGDGAPLAPARLYNDAASEAAVAEAVRLAGGAHPATAPTASLCKTIDYARWPLLPAGAAVVSAADYATAWLGRAPARLAVTDDNNALKAGWDPAARAYEPWWAAAPPARLLAQHVVAPGAATGVTASAASGLPAGCALVGGTTDSVAAFVAAAGGAAPPPGTAVTSLGTTLALKLASGVRVDDGASGVYSHRLGGGWLVGGASNVGCGVLREVGFSDADLVRLSASMDASTPAPHAYYPLPPQRAGERFPTVDPAKRAVLTPRPPDDADYLKCILDGVARVEAAGYARLAELGAPTPTLVLTAGGGARNPAWTALRARRLAPARVVEAERGEAAVGAALLAASGGEGYP